MRGLDSGTGDASHRALKHGPEVIRIGFNQKLMMWLSLQIIARSNTFPVEDLRSL